MFVGLALFDLDNQNSVRYNILTVTKQGHQPMKPDTRYNRYKANRQPIDDALILLANTVANRENCGPHFAIGYLTSFVADFLANQGKAQREEFLAHVQTRQDMITADAALTQPKGD